MAFLVFYIPCPDEPAARRMADHALNNRVAACANIMPVTSCYWWEGTLQHDQEWVVLLKTAPEMESRVEEVLQAQHPYSVPCIMRWEVRANLAYENWIREMVGL